MVSRVMLRTALWLAMSGLAIQAAPAKPAAPMRVVSTAPSITETLFALELGSRVVGVSDFCRFPPEVTTLPKVGTFLKPDAERIAGLRPDLVIVNPVSSDLDRRLTMLQIPFIVVERGTSSNVFETIRRIGAATGVTARAEALVHDLQARLANVRRTAVAGPRRTVILIIGRQAGSLTDLVAVGRDSYLDDLIGIAGGTNLLGSAGMPAYPRISMETVLRLNPDVIIDTVDMGDTEAERHARQVTNARLWAAYPTLAAVKANRVFAATTDALVVPGPRIVDAAEWLAALLAGEPPR
jgi:iron complex transport system substrate-binding protein